MASIAKMNLFKQDQSYSGFYSNLVLIKQRFSNIAKKHVGLTNKNLWGKP